MTLEQTKEHLEEEVNMMEERGVFPDWIDAIAKHRNNVNKILITLCKEVQDLREEIEDIKRRILATIE